MFPSFSRISFFVSFLHNALLRRLSYFYWTVGYMYFVYIFFQGHHLTDVRVLLSINIFVPFADSVWKTTLCALYFLHVNTIFCVQGYFFSSPLGKICVCILFKWNIFLSFIKESYICITQLSLNLKVVAEHSGRDNHITKKFIVPKTRIIWE